MLREVRLAIYMMAWVSFGARGTSHTFQEHQEPSTLHIMHSASANSFRCIHKWSNKNGRRKAAFLISFGAENHITTDSHKTSGVGWVNIQKAYGFECKRRTTSTITIDSNTHVNYLFYRSSDDPTACTSKKQTLVTISPTAKDSGVVLGGRM